MRIGFAEVGFLIVLLILVPTTAGAQDSRPFVPLQMRVRMATVTFGDQRVDLIGHLTNLNTDSVVVRAPDGTRMAVPIASLQRFELSQGVHNYLRKGAWYGLAGGIAGGVGSALFLVCGERRCQNVGDSRAQYAFILGLGGGLVGTGIGALVGSLIRTERWHEVPLPALRAAASR